MTTQLDFVTLDVFTETPFKGNPLGVVHIPPPTGPGASQSLTQEQKQTIAREIGYSETIFIHDVAPEQDDDPRTRRIDIFTVHEELPFAGHPTIGGASYLQSQGVNKIITKAGPIPISILPGGQVSASIPHNTHLNSKVVSDMTGLKGLHELEEISTAELKAPIFSIVRGMTFALIRLPSLEVLAQPRIGNFDYKAAQLMDEDWRETFLGRLYYVILESEVTSSGHRHVKIRSRMVERALEDPATGSAACALASYLSLHEFKGETSFSFEITQGVEMGRQSDISVETTVKVGEDGQRQMNEVRLGGTARQIMKGVMAAPPA